MAGGFDFVVDLFQPAYSAAHQNHGGAVGGVGFGGGAANAATGSGYHDNAVFQKIGGCLVILHNLSPCSGVVRPVRAVCVRKGAYCNSFARSLTVSAMMSACHKSTVWG